MPLLYNLATTLLAVSYVHAQAYLYLLISVFLLDALLKIHVENLSSFVVDRYYSMYHNSHPTLTERLAAVEAMAVQKAKTAKAD